MKKSSWGKVLVTMWMMVAATSAWASPLFPDVPDEHWAKDAVASLAAKGLVEGYPDGTFKGDRAATRWETAMIVARLLAKMEQQNGTFATRAELDELRKLVNALREELDALGVRVDNLEENTALLDKRVTELERISFYGSLDSRFTFQSFNNEGGTGTPASTPTGYYDRAIGSRVAPPWRPQVQGVLPVVDYRVGRALTNGTGFTSLAILGLKIVVTPDIDAGVEFAAYSSQGDSIVDAYWGVSAPYLSNPFTANAGSNLDNTPFTKMTLDHFWVVHKPSGTRLLVGSIDKTNMSSMVYAGAPNLGVYGPKRFPGYGFDLSGGHEFSKTSKLTYEVLGTHFGNGVRFNGLGYQNNVVAGNVAYKGGPGHVQIDYARMSEEAPSGTGTLDVGLTNGLNLPYGAASGWTIRQWVNPPGYYANQLSALERSQNGTIPNTSDKRPVPGWNGNADNTIGMAAGAGNYGPQEQFNYGVTGGWDFPLSDSTKITVVGDYGRSDYRPNRNSSYNTIGTAIRADVGLDLFKGDLQLGAEFLRVEPNYSPASWSGNVLGGRLIKAFNYTGVAHLHDNVKYPHNREGVRLRGKWLFDEKAGTVWANASFLEQQRTSLYDVRVNAGALGLATPTNDVVGFAPGFVDPIFYGFAHPSVYGSRSTNSFTSGLAPLENPRGKEHYYELGASYLWKDPGVRVSGSWSRNDLSRRTSLDPSLGGSQNAVDIDVDSWAFEVGYQASKKIWLNAGFDNISTVGHYDPSGLYNAYALKSGSTSFENIDSNQFVPNVSMDYTISDNTFANVTARYYDTHDGVNSAIEPGNGLLGMSQVDAHPFSWAGWQLSSEFKVNF